MIVAPEDFVHMTIKELSEKHVELLNQHESLQQKYHEAVEKIAELQSKINQMENETDDLVDEIDRQKSVSVKFMSKIVLQAKLNNALLEALSAYESLLKLKE